MEPAFISFDKDESVHLNTLVHSHLCASRTEYTHAMLHTSCLATIMACLIHVLFNMYEKEEHSREVGKQDRKTESRTIKMVVFF